MPITYNNLMTNLIFINKNIVINLISLSQYLDDRNSAYCLFCDCYIGYRYIG